ncbi:MAG: hypothetical protein KA536_00115 [Saprospiraceae bacterium]|nr:hypothetical protein [Saprospiraceae bacterium]
MKSTYDKIVHSISNMDADQLFTLLDDKKSYNDITKIEFINRLRSVFAYLLDDGRETKLIPVSGACGLTECINCDNPGITFKGVSSDKYFSLIFDTTNGEVTDIYECKSFRLQNGDVLQDQIKLGIYEEDKITFVDDVDYHISIQNCEAAINKLKKGGGSHIRIYDIIDIILTYLPKGAFINIQESNDCYDRYKRDQQHLIPTWIKVLKPYYDTHLPLMKYIHNVTPSLGYVELSSEYNIRLDITPDIPFLKFMINYQEALEWVKTYQKNY